MSYLLFWFATPSSRTQFSSQYYSYTSYKTKLQRKGDCSPDLEHVWNVQLRYSSRHEASYVPEKDPIFFLIKLCQGVASFNQSSPCKGFMECPGLPASGLSQPPASCRVNLTKNKNSTSSYWDTEFRPTKKSCCCTSTCAFNRAVPSILATQDLASLLTVSSDRNTAPTTLTPGNQRTLSGTHRRDTATACLFKRFNSGCTILAVRGVPINFCLCEGFLWKHDSMIFLTC